MRNVFVVGVLAIGFLGCAAMSSGEDAEASDQAVNEGARTAGVTTLLDRTLPPGTRTGLSVDTSGRPYFFDTESRSVTRLGERDATTVYKSPGARFPHGIAFDEHTLLVSEMADTFYPSVVATDLDGKRPRVLGGLGETGEYVETPVFATRKTAYWLATNLAAKSTELGSWTLRAYDLTTRRVRSIQTVATVAERSRPTHLLVDATAAYIAESVVAGSSRLVRIGLTDRSVTELATHVGNVDSLAMDASTLYYTAEIDPKNYVDELRSLSKDGGPPATIAKVFHSRVAVDDMHVYFTDHETLAARDKKTGEVTKLHEIARSETFDALTVGRGQVYAHVYTYRKDEAYPHKVLRVAAPGAAPNR